MAPPDAAVADPSSASTSSSGDKGTAQTTQSSQQPAQGSTTQAASQPDKKWEDDPRWKGALTDLKKEREQRQTYERNAAALQARLEERERQLNAMVGNRIPSKDEADADAIRQRFSELFPGLAKLNEAQVERLLQIAGQGDQLEAATTHHWTNHGRQMLDQVHKGIAVELGDLTDRQKRRINVAYVAEAEADPQFLQRHESGDPTLVREFVKQFLDDLVEPVRRKVTASEVNRNRLVPNGKDRSMPQPGGKKIDVNDKKAVEDLLVDGFKAKGGVFGRR